MHGVLHMGLVVEGPKAKYFGEGRPFGRAGFDEWVADYDLRGSPLRLLLPQGVTRCVIRGID